MSPALEEIAGIPPVGAPYVLGRWHKHAATPKGYVKGLLAASRAARHRSAPRAKFLIFGRARSGTTLLCHLLGQVPDIHCDHEVLHYRMAFPQRYVARVLPRTATAPVYGCKLLSYQLVEVQRIGAPEAFFAALAQEGYRFLHARRDTFAQSLSLSVALARRHFFAERGPAPKGPIPLDPDRFVAQLRWNTALLRMETRLLAPFEPLEVAYETAFADPARHQAAIDRICRFVGAEPGPVAAPIARVLTKSFDETVANAGALRRAMRAAGFDHLLAPA